MAPNLLQPGAQALCLLLGTESERAVPMLLLQTWHPSHCTHALAKAHHVARPKVNEAGRYTPQQEAQKFSREVGEDPHTEKQM